MIPIEVRRRLAVVLDASGATALPVIDASEPDRLLAGTLFVRDDAHDGLTGELSPTELGAIVDLVGDAPLFATYRSSAAGAPELMDLLLDGADRHAVVVHDEAAGRLAVRGAIEAELELEDAPVATSSTTVVVTGEDGEELRLPSATLPHTLLVEIPPRGGRITIALEARAPLRTRERTLDLPLGGSTRVRRVEVSARRAVAGDDLVVRCADEPRARVLAPGAAAVVRDDRPVTVHVAFDTTTVDLEVLPDMAGAPRAPAAPPEWALDGAEDVPVDAPPPRAEADWNADLRAAAFAALGDVARALPKGSRVATSWFADRVRPGGVEPRVPEAANAQATGFLGERAADDLGDLGAHAALHYRPGLDLVDALDESLAEIAARVSADRSLGRRHVVLVIGDSPPPPSPEPGDPLHRLFGSPRRVGTRVSTVLDRALGDLGRAGVPTVEYVFLAPSCTVEPLDALTRGVIDLSRRVADALSRRPGFHVVDADRARASIADAMRRALAHRPLPRVLAEEVA